MFSHEYGTFSMETRASPFAGALFFLSRIMKANKYLFHLIMSKLVNFLSRNYYLSVSLDKFRDFRKLLSSSIWWADNDLDVCNNSR